MDMTLIVDQVEYEMPFGPLGRVAHKVFLRRQIQETFAFRQQEIARIFGQLTPEPRRQYPHSQAS
jgi:ligand-binding SRPBCC domain-containing protein